MADDERDLWPSVQYRYQDQYRHVDPADGSMPLMLALHDLPWLMQEVERLRATLEAMRPLVVALAGPGGLLTCNEDGYSCVFCESDDWMPEGRYADVRHTPDCPVTQARALKQRMGW